MTTRQHPESAAPARSMQPARFRAAAPMVALVLVVVLVMVVVGELMIDLRVYRIGGRALLDGDPLYEARDVTGLPFTYTPFAAVLFVPAALLPFGLAMVAASTVAAAALVRSVWLVLRLARGGRVRPAAVAAVVLVMLLTEPVGSTVGFGQVNLLIMWLILEDLIGAVPARWRGVLVGVAAGFKLTPGLFVVYFLVCRRWADAARSIAAGLVTVLLGFAVQPGQAWDYWTGVAYDSGRVGGVAYAGNQSIHGAVERLFGPEVPTWSWLLLALAVAAVGLATAATLHRRGDELGAITAVAFTMLLVSPISWNHHWVWVLLLVGLAVVPGRARAARCWLGAGVVILGSRVIWLADYRNDAEYGTGGLAVLAQNAYVIVGLAVLGWLAWSAARTHESGDHQGVVTGPGAARG